MPIRDGGGGATSYTDEIFTKREVRSYPFDIVLNAGLSSASSSASLNAPCAELFSGTLTAPPQSKGREMGERAGPTVDIWTGMDGLNYWGRKMVANVYMTVGVSNLTWIAGADANMYAGLFLFAPGLPPWSLTPGVPYTMLLYRRLTNGSGTIETWELWTAEGNTNAAKITTLTGVSGPNTPFSAGGAKTQRLGIVYNPGISVKAYIDGVLGATHTTNLPVTSTIPTAQVLAGVGAYIDTGQGADSARSGFHNLILETYR